MVIMYDEQIILNATIIKRAMKFAELVAGTTDYFDAGQVVAKKVTKTIL